MREGAGEIVSTPRVLLFVFVPIVMGQLYQQFTVTISVARLLSPLNALTLSPALCTVLLRKPEDGADEKGKNVVFRTFHEVLGKAKDGYVSLTGRLRQKAWIAVATIGVFYAASAGLTPLVPDGFNLPDAYGCELSSLSCQRT